MCLYPQFIQRQDIDRLLANGFTSVGSCGVYKRITPKQKVKTKSGTRIILPISDYMFDPDEPEFQILTPKQKQYNADRHFVRHYDCNPQDFYLLNPQTGEVEPLYIEVPCGYCEDCRHTRIGKIANKVFLQSCTAGNPYFVTLTFSPKNENKFNLWKKPTKSDNDPFQFSEQRKSLHEQRVEIIQKFLKRLRKRLAYYGYKEKLTYCIVSERGKHGHFHYHGLFWLPNTPELQKLYWFLVKDKKGEYVEVCEPCFGRFVSDTWQHGYTKTYLDRDQQGRANAGKYLFKYMSKSDNWHERVELKSRIGNEKIEEYREWFLENPESQVFEVKNQFTGQLEKIPVTSWVLDKFIPSLSRSVSHRDRYVLTLYNDILNNMALQSNLNNPQIFEWYEYKYSLFCKKFEPLFKNGFLQKNPQQVLSNDDYMRNLHRLIKLDRQINHISKKYDFEQCVFLDKLRKKHTEIVAQNIEQSDLTLLRDWRRVTVARMIENEKDEM